MARGRQTRKKVSGELRKQAVAPSTQAAAAEAVGTELEAAAAPVAVSAVAAPAASQAAPAPAPAAVAESAPSAAAAVAETRTYLPRRESTDVDAELPSPDQRPARIDVGLAEATSETAHASAAKVSDAAQGEAQAVQNGAPSAAAPVECPATSTVDSAATDATPAGVAAPVAAPVAALEAAPVAAPVASLVAALAAPPLQVPVEVPPPLLLPAEAMLPAEAVLPAAAPGPPPERTGSPRHPHFVDRRRFHERMLFHDPTPLYFTNKTARQPPTQREAWSTNLGGLGGGPPSSVDPVMGDNGPHGIPLPSFSGLSATSEFGVPSSLYPHPPATARPAVLTRGGQQQQQHFSLSASGVTPHPFGRNTYPSPGFNNTGFNNTSSFGVRSRPKPPPVSARDWSAEYSELADSLHPPGLLPPTLSQQERLVRDYQWKYARMDIERELYARDAATTAAQVAYAVSLQDRAATAAAIHATSPGLAPFVDSGDGIGQDPHPQAPRPPRTGGVGVGRRGRPWRPQVPTMRGVSDYLPEIKGASPRMVRGPQAARRGPPAPGRSMPPEVTMLMREMHADRSGGNIGDLGYGLATM